MGISSLSPSSSSLAQIHTEDSSASQPILMITTPGADPTQELEDYASRVMPGKYAQLAMGGQQTVRAITMLHEAAKAGHWLCLKNLHLVVHWVPQLEKELAGVTPHPAFRLWLTTEPHANFPAILLQQSLKITFEAHTRPASHCSTGPDHAPLSATPSKRTLALQVACWAVHMAIG